MSKYTDTRAKKDAAIAKYGYGSQASKTTSTNESKADIGGSKTMSASTYKKYEQNYNNFKKTGSYGDTSWMKQDEIDLFNNIRKGNGKSALSNGNYYYMDSDTYDKYGKNRANWKNTGDYGDTSWMNQDDLNAYKAIRSSQDDYTNGFDDFRYSLNDEVLEEVRKAWKNGYGTNNWYDMDDPEDLQRQAQGIMPKYTERNYDLNDVYGRWLYENELPNTLKAFSKSYDSKLDKWNETQEERNGILNSFIDNYNNYNQQKEDYFNALYGDESAKQRLINSGNYDTFISYYNENADKQEDNPYKARQNAINGNNREIYDKAWDNILNGENPDNEFWENYKESDWNKYVQDKLKWSDKDYQEFAINNKWQNRETVPGGFTNVPLTEEGMKVVQSIGVMEQQQKNVEKAQKDVAKVEKELESLNAYAESLPYVPKRIEEKKAELEQQRRDIYESVGLNYDQVVSEQNAQNQEEYNLNKAVDDAQKEYNRLLARGQRFAGATDTTEAKAKLDKAKAEREAFYQNKASEELAMREEHYATLDFDAYKKAREEQVAQKQKELDELKEAMRGRTTGTAFSGMTRGEMQNKAAELQKEINNLSSATLEETASKATQVVNGYVNRQIGTRQVADVSNWSKQNQQLYYAMIGEQNSLNHDLQMSIAERMEYATDQEKATINGVANLGEQAFVEYTDSLKDVTGIRQQFNMGEQMKAFAREHPFLSSAASVPMSMLSSMEGWANQIGGNLGIADANDIVSNSIMTTASTSIRSAISDEILLSNSKSDSQILRGISNGELYSFLYNTGMSVVDSLARRSLMFGMDTDSAELFGNITLAMSGGSAGSGVLLNNLLGGRSTREALVLAGVTTTAEILTEKVSLDNLIKTKNAGNLREFLINAGKQAFVEGSEEVASEIITTIADVIEMRDDSDLMRAVQKRIESGDTEAQAIAKEIASSLGVAFAGGALSGFSSGLGTAVGGKANFELNSASNALENYFNNGDVIAQTVDGEQAKFIQARAAMTSDVLSLGLTDETLETELLSVNDYLAQNSQALLLTEEGQALIKSHQQKLHNLSMEVAEHSAEQTKKQAKAKQRLTTLYDNMVALQEQSKGSVGNKEHAALIRKTQNAIRVYTDEYNNYVNEQNVNKIKEQKYEEQLNEKAQNIAEETASEASVLTSELNKPMDLNSIDAEIRSTQNEMRTMDRNSGEYEAAKLYLEELNGRRMEIANNELLAQANNSANAFSNAQMLNNDAQTQSVVDNMIEQDLNQNTQQYSVQNPTIESAIDTANRLTKASTEEWNEAMKPYKPVLVTYSPSSAHFFNDSKNNAQSFAVIEIDGKTYLIPSRFDRNLSNSSLGRMYDINTNVENSTPNDYRIVQPLEVVKEGAYYYLVDNNGNPSWSNDFDKKNYNKGQIDYIDNRAKSSNKIDTNETPKAKQTQSSIVDNVVNPVQQNDVQNNIQQNEQTQNIQQTEQLNDVQQEIAYEDLPESEVEGNVERANKYLAEKVSDDTIVSTLKYVSDETEVGSDGLPKGLSREQRAILYAWRNDRVQKALEKVNTQNRIRIQKMMQNYEARDKRYKNVKTIKSTVKDLYKMMATPNVKKGNYVINQMQPVIMDFLNSIDLGSQYRTGGKEVKNWRLGIRNLADALTDYRARQSIEEQDTKYSTDNLDIPAEMFDSMQMIAKAVTRNGVNYIQDLSNDEISSLADCVRVLNSAVKNSNRLIASNRGATISEASENAITELEARKFKPKYNQSSDKSSAGETVRDLVSIDMLTPTSMIRRIGKSGGEILRNVRDGFFIGTGKIRQAQSYINQLREKNGVTKKDTRNWRREGVEYLTDNGEQLRMSLGQLGSLYALSFRPQAVQHILGQGIEIKGTEYNRKVDSNKSYKITENDMNNLFDMMPENEKAFVRDLQRYLSTEVAKWGNEVSQKMYGIDMYTEDNYFPIKSGKTNTKLNDPKEKARLYNVPANASFTKMLNPNANNAIEIGDALDVVTDHISQMANYNGFAIPIADTLKWLNYKSVDADGKVDSNRNTVQALDAALGKGATQYIINLIKDINGTGLDGNTSGAGVYAKLMGNAKKAAVAAKLRVMLQQPTAVARATMEINPSHFANGYSLKDGIKEMQEYSNVAYWKSQGNFDIGTGKSTRDILFDDGGTRDNIENALMKPVGVADDIGWGLIWNAVKHEQASRHKSMDINSDAFMNLVKNRFEDVIHNTQVIDTVVNRTQLMRSKSDVVKYSTAFQSEPSLTYNMIVNAIDDVAQGKEGAKRRAARMVGSVVSNWMLNAFVTAMYDAIRYREKGEDLGELFWQNYKDDMLDNLKPWEYIPVIKDLVNSIAGQDTSRMDVAALSDMANATRRILKAYTDADGDNMFEKISTIMTDGGNGYTPAGLFNPFIKSVSSLTGTPVNGILSNIEFASNAISPGSVRYKQYSNLESAKNQLIEEGMDSNSVYSLLVGVGNNSKTYDSQTTGTKALSIVTADSDGDGSPDFSEREQDMIAEVLGITGYTNHKDKYDNLKDYGLQMADDYIEDHPDTNIFDTYFELLGR